LDDVGGPTTCSASDRCQPRHRPRHGQTLQQRGLARADDLSDVDVVREALPEIKRVTGGRLDALINNAAISPKHADGSKITSLEMAYKDWLHIFNVNFFSAILLAQGLSDLLIESKGSIVNMTSIVGSRVHPFASAAYATSKAGLPWRDRYRDSVARHRGNRAARNPHAAAGQTERGGGPAVLPLLEPGALYQRV
jgi:NAD(P)-dependent dehydrogenase (short-subunit alcohol dehydrogenase family)